MHCSMPHQPRPCGELARRYDMVVGWVFAVTAVVIWVRAQMFLRIASIHCK